MVCMQCRERIIGGPSRYCAPGAGVSEAASPGSCSIVSASPARMAATAAASSAAGKLLKRRKAYDIRDNGLVASIVNQETFQILL